MKTHKVMTCRVRAENDHSEIAWTVEFEGNTRRACKHYLKTRIQAKDENLRSAITCRSVLDFCRLNPT